MYGIQVVLALLIIGDIIAAPVTTKPPTPKDPNNNKQTILNYGRSLNREISKKLTNNIYAFNGEIRKYAVNIPNDSALKDLNMPLQFTSNLGNMIAPYFVRRMVSRPIEAATESIAKWVDQFSVSSKMFSDFVAIAFGNSPKN